MSKQLLALAAALTFSFSLTACDAKEEKKDDKKGDAKKDDAKKDDAKEGDEKKEGEEKKEGGW